MEESVSMLLGSIMRPPPPTRLLNRTRPSSRPLLPSKPPNVIAPALIINLVISSLALILNFTEMAIIIRKKRIKLFERILLSLCVADILVSIYYPIQKTYQHYKTKEWYGLDRLGEHFGILSSIANIVVLGIDRLLAVKYPLRHKAWMSKRRVNIMIAIAWVSSLTLTIVCNANRFARINATEIKTVRVSSITFGTLVFLCGVVITTVYAIIIFTVLKSRRKRRKMNMQVNGGKTVDETAVTITCINVVIAYSICTYPHVIDILANDHPALPFKFILLNSLLDPIVYFFKSYLKKKLAEKSTNSAEIGLTNATRFTPSGTPSGTPMSTPMSTPMGTPISARRSTPSQILRPKIKPLET
eukprot:gene6268-6989_t